MKKYLIAAAGLSAIAAAAPAAAQYYPAPNSGYNQPVQYGYTQAQGYGYNNRDQRGLVRSYIVRADQLRQRIDRLDGRDRVSEREADRLRAAARDLQNRTRAYAQGGLTRGERRDLDVRITRLQQRIQIDRRDGRNGRNGWVDRNRNGIDDRQERMYRADRDRDGVRDGRDGWIDRNRNGIDDRYEQRRWDRDDD